MNTTFLLSLLFLLHPTHATPPPSKAKLSPSRPHRNVSQTSNERALPSQKQDVLHKIRTYLRRSIPRMTSMGFPLDGSYCHVGAAYSAAYITRLGISAHLFQPRTMHMLTYFDLDGKRYFVDQTMAQFFRKGSPAHKKLMQSGGWIGTKEDFVRFYSQHVDDVAAFGEYKDGGRIDLNTAETKDVSDPYAMWDKGVDGLDLNSRKARIQRVLRVWYQDFATDTSHDQNSGLLWTAKYFYNLFSIKVHVTRDYR